MKRRALLASATLAPLGAALAVPPRVVRAAEPATAAAWRHFEVTSRVTLLGSTGPAQLWLPLAQTAGGYQTALDLQWRGNGDAELVHDARYGAGILRVVWHGAGGSQHIEVVQLVATRDRGPTPLLPLTAAERELWTAPTESVPTDGIVRETAQRITAGLTAPRERLRALYDWVVDTTWRDPNTPGCGTGDFMTMLQTGHFGGKCADINGLFVGLVRAAGLPARDVYGIRVADSRFFPSLGRSGDITRAQHCRAEIFLDGAGWFPADPADVRKVVLEAKLPIDHPDVARLRDGLFGHWEMNWIGYNSANDVELPGAGQQKPNFAFLMYPCAFTATGQPDCLDPARFHYEITARELAT